MDLRASAKETNFKKFQRLLDALDVKSIIHRRKKRPLVAVKLHFGEKGNAAFIRPVYVRQVVDKIWDLGGRPFLTDANTVYVGTRSESVSHLTTAIENGFAYTVVRAPWSSPTASPARPKWRLRSTASSSSPCFWPRPSWRPKPW